MAEREEDEYVIPFVGLKTGIHEVHYEVDGEFFKEAEQSGAEQCKAQIRLQFEKSPSLFVLNFFVDGHVNVPCDRCGIDYEQPIFGDYVVYVKFEYRAGEIDEEADVIHLDPGATHLNVRPLIYDYVSLSIPAKRVHPNDEKGNSTCDPDMLKRLQSEAEQKAKTADPRWEALKKLK